VVIFADASVNGAEPFYFKRIEPKSDLSFSTHSIQPESVLALAVELFGAAAQAYVLGIRGYDFNEFGQRLSQKAGQNLQEAVKFITSAVENRDFTETK
jgi:hydrogenase maturation protease